MEKNKNNTNKKRPVAIQCLWGVLCSLSSVDQERNNISLFNVIDQLNLPVSDKGIEERKVFPLPFELVTLWRRILNTNIDNSEITTDIEIKLLDPNERILQQTVAPVKFNRDSRRSRLRIKILGLPITTIGDYVFEISVKQPGSDTLEMAKTIPFEIREQKQNLL